MNISSVRIALPFSSGREEEAKCSLISRITLSAVGAIALIAGVLILLGNPGFSPVGATTGGALMTLGSITLCVTCCLRCVNTSLRDTVDLNTQPTNSSSSEPERQKNDGVTRSNEVETRAQSVFATITPANYEQHLDLSLDFYLDAAETGDYILTKGIHEEDFEWLRPAGRIVKKGDVYLNGVVRNVDDGSYCACGLEIQDGKFVHFPQKSAPPVSFSNLQDFFDYLFRGEYYQGECLKDLKFFRLKMLDGRFLCYPNPYLT